MPTDRQQHLAYDQFNNLASVTDSTGSTTTFTYDSSGNMTSQTDPNGNITRFEYNSLNQLIKITDPQNNITTYTYDKNGNQNIPDTTAMERQPIMNTTTETSSQK